MDRLSWGLPFGESLQDLPPGQSALRYRVSGGLFGSEDFLLALGAIVLLNYSLFFPPRFVRKLFFIAGLQRRVKLLVLYQCFELR